MCHLVRLCLKPCEKDLLPACLCRRRMWTIRSTAAALLPGRRRLVAASANWAPARSVVPLAAGATYADAAASPPSPRSSFPSIWFSIFLRPPRFCVQCASKRCLPFARVSPFVALAITLRSLPATGEFFRPVTGPSSPPGVFFFGGCARGCVRCVCV